MIKLHVSLLLLFFSLNVFSQIKGTILDKQTGNPIAYSNIWIKGTKSGTSSDKNGVFIFEKAVVGDTLKISSIGYGELDVIAKKDNQIFLDPIAITLDKVTLESPKYTRVKKITTYQGKQSIPNYYSNGHYSIARYFQYKKNYKENQYIKKIETITWSSNKNKVYFKMYLLKADSEGNPTNILLSEPKVFYTKRGIRELKWNLKDAHILFPKEGFFVAIDRINIKEHLHHNEYQKNIIQPSIGIESESNIPNTWLKFSGDWIHPEELSMHIGSNKNIAINIELTD